MPRGERILIDQRSILWLFLKMVSSVCCLSEAVPVECASGSDRFQFRLVGIQSGSSSGLCGQMVSVSVRGHLGHVIATPWITECFSFPNSDLSLRVLMVVKKVPRSLLPGSQTYPSGNTGPYSPSVFIIKMGLTLKNPSVFCTFLSPVCKNRLFSHSFLTPMLKNRY